MKDEPVAVGIVESVCVNGRSVDDVWFGFAGPVDDRHATYNRTLSGHDGAYRRTSALQKGDWVFNWRTWTALSREEVALIEEDLGYKVPVGCLLENITFSGIPHFSKLAPASRIVFPEKFDLGQLRRRSQVILAVWEENGPCKGVGDRMERFHNVPGLCKEFIAKAQNRRGVMGFVLSYGRVAVGDQVKVYSPV